MYRNPNRTPKALRVYSGWIYLSTLARATSHPRLIAHDPCMSSTLIGGKGGAEPSLLYTTLEGPTE